ncbi:MAG: squalene synthase HpnC [Janthinobacterium lividum]
MTATTALASGKNASTENFPVASWLIAPAYRPAIMAFYRFARTADDVADHPEASADEKLRLLEAMRATVAGEVDIDPGALALRRTLVASGLDARHPLDLLAAFRRDVTTPRTADWDALVDYCRVSAMPVGRFVLDVHGEDRANWTASDALCTALQVVNHLQDCGEDFRAMGRVYIPDTMLAAAGLDTDVLAAPRSPPALRAIVIDLAERCDALLRQSAGFARQLRNRRLAMEVAVIQRLAEDLSARLKRRDPLAERVVHGKAQAARLAFGAIVRLSLRR